MGDKCCQAIENVKSALTFVKPVHFMNQKVCAFAVKLVAVHNTAEQTKLNEFVCLQFSPSIEFIFSFKQHQPVLFVCTAGIM